MWVAGTVATAASNVASAAWQTTLSTPKFIETTVVSQLPLLKGIAQRSVEGAVEQHHHFRLRPSSDFLSFCTSLHTAETDDEVARVVGGQVDRLEMQLARTSILDMGERDRREVVIEGLLCTLLGHPCRGVARLAVQLVCGGTSPSEKRLGYLALQLGVPSDASHRLMVWNTVSTDLTATPPSIISAALLALPHLMQPDQLPLLELKVLRCLENPAPEVRRLALNCLACIQRCYGPRDAPPPHLSEAARERLRDVDPSVGVAAVVALRKLFRSSPPQSFREDIEHLHRTLLELRESDARLVGLWYKGHVTPWGLIDIAKCYAAWGSPPEGTPCKDLLQKTLLAFLRAGVASPIEAAVVVEVARAMCAAGVPSADLWGESFAKLAESDDPDVRYLLLKVLPTVADQLHDSALNRIRPAMATAMWGADVQMRRLALEAAGATSHRESVGDALHHLKVLLDQIDRAADPTVGWGLVCSVIGMLSRAWVPHEVVAAICAKLILQHYGFLFPPSAFLDIVQHPAVQPPEVESPHITELLSRCREMPPDLRRTTTLAIIKGAQKHRHPGSIVHFAVDLVDGCGGELETLRALAQLLSRRRRGVKRAQERSARYLFGIITTKMRMLDESPPLRCVAHELLGSLMQSRAPHVRQLAAELRVLLDIAGIGQEPQQPQQPQPQQPRQPQQPQPQQPGTEGVDRHLSFLDHMVVSSDAPPYDPSRKVGVAKAAPSPPISFPPSCDLALLPPATRRWGRLGYSAPPAPSPQPPPPAPAPLAPPEGSVTDRTALVGTEHVAVQTSRLYPPHGVVVKLVVVVRCGAPLQNLVVVINTGRQNVVIKVREEDVAKAHATHIKNMTQGRQSFRIETLQDKVVLPFTLEPAPSAPKPRGWTIGGSVSYTSAMGELPLRLNECEVLLESVDEGLVRTTLPFKLTVSILEALRPVVMDNEEFEHLWTEAAATGELRVVGGRLPSPLAGAKGVAPNEMAFLAAQLSGDHHLLLLMWRDAEPQGAEGPTVSTSEYTIRSDSVDLREAVGDALRHVTQ